MSAFIWQRAQGYIAHIAYTALAAEMQRELCHRKSTLPKRVLEGRMRQVDADYQLTIWRVLCEDVPRMRDNAPLHIETAFSHKDRCAALEREIKLREKFYPIWIAKGRLHPERATQQIELIDAMLYRYQTGFDWRLADGSVYHLALQAGGAIERAARKEWQQYWVNVARSRNLNEFQQPLQTAML
jgi:hypothetical protein